jgi:hypothetical protein
LDLGGLCCPGGLSLVLNQLGDQILRIGIMSKSFFGTESAPGFWEEGSTHVDHQIIQSGNVLSISPYPAI